MIGVVGIVGEPGAGKSSFLYYLMYSYENAGYRCIAVSQVDTVHSGLPLGVEDAMDMEHALEIAGDDPHVVIFYDELNLEVEGGKPSPELRAVAKFRRHMHVGLVFTTQRIHDLPPAARDLDVKWRLMRFSDESSWEYGWMRRKFPRALDQLADLTPYWWDGPADPPPAMGVHYVIGR